MEEKNPHTFLLNKYYTCQTNGQRETGCCTWTHSVCFLHMLKWPTCPPTFKSTVNFSPGSRGHDRAAGLRAELCNGPVQHVDLVEEIHRWKGNAAGLLTVETQSGAERRIAVVGVNVPQNSAKTNTPPSVRHRVADNFKTFWESESLWWFLHHQATAPCWFVRLRVASRALQVTASCSRHL